MFICHMPPTFPLSDNSLDLVVIDLFDIYANVNSIKITAYANFGIKVFIYIYSECLQWRINRICILYSCFVEYWL